MSTPARLSQEAHARILGFSVVLAAIAVLAIGIGVAITVASGTVVLHEGDRPSTSSDYYTPWDNPFPMEAVADGGSFTGRGQAFMQLDGLDPHMPIEVTWSKETSDSIRSVSLLRPGDTRERARVYSYDDHRLMLPGATSVRLWVHTSSTAEWTVRVTPAELPQESGIVSGLGDHVFIYTGDATTARAVTRNGLLRIEAITESGSDDVLSLRDKDEGSFAWSDSSAVIFLVTSYGDAPWSITFFEDTPAPSPAPEPDETDAERTEGADADE